MDETTICTHCARPPSPQRPAVLWSMALRDGRRLFLCSPCAREHLSGIEGGADGSMAAWWHAA